MPRARPLIAQGFDALAYTEHSDYEAVASTNPDFNKAIVRVNVFREHRQTIQYIQPHDHEKLSQVCTGVLRCMACAHWVVRRCAVLSWCRAVLCNAVLFVGREAPGCI